MAGRLLTELGLTARTGAAVRIAGLTPDSRKVRPGFLFAALPGSRAHGAEYVAQVLAAGAVAVLTDPAGARMVGALPDGVALVVADDPREALARAAALWFGAQPEVTVAVTGTNGKTSVASFCRQLWTLLGHAACNLGTVGVEGAYSAPLAHTTPEPVELHGLLADMAAAGVTRLAMEASSHGLDQRRLDGVRIRAAGFTNLTRDHLDYHLTMEAYFRAKLGLFDRLLPEDGVAVVNLDDPHGPQVATAAQAAGAAVLGTGRTAAADLRLLGQRFDATGQEMRIDWRGVTRQVRLGLIGGFQAENVLVAAGLCIAAGETAGDVFDALPRLVTVRGRMQHAATRDNGAAVFVDYAHTPDAVATALRALRPHVMGRLVAVLGAGGDRDRGKRPLMGKAAAANADAVFVTDDNPRSEDPASIRAEILQACPGAAEVGDRAEAILRAVDALQPGDALLIMGKGHERGQIVGTTTYPFDDVEQASLAVAALDGRA